MASRVFPLLFFAAAPRVVAASQTPAPEVGIGFGVDTSAADIGPIVRLVRTYLTASDSSARARLWFPRNSRDPTQRDLAGRYARQGFPASVVGVLPTDMGDSVYVVKLLHGRAERAGGPMSPMALERIYAVRAPTSPYGWQLAGALPRLTQSWPTHIANRIVFHYEPGQLRDTTRAKSAARLVDSAAALFAVRPPPRVDYYVTASPDAYFRALGLDFFVLQSGRGQATGGNALPDVAGVLAGDPAQGEAYRHELVHVALGSRVRSGFINEGIAAWLGGSRRQSLRQLYSGLIAFQRSNPNVTFGQLLRDKSSVPGSAIASSDAWYASGALVTETVFRRAGRPGLRALADTPPEARPSERVIARLLGLRSGTELDRWWRMAPLTAVDATK